MTVIKLTEAKIRTLPLGSGIHRDEDGKGSYVDMPQIDPYICCAR